MVRIRIFLGLAVAAIVLTLVQSVISGKSLLGKFSGRSGVKISAPGGDTQRAPGGDTQGRV